MGIAIFVVLFRACITSLQIGKHGEANEYFMHSWEA